MMLKHGDKQNKGSICTLTMQSITALLTTGPLMSLPWLIYRSMKHLLSLLVTFPKQPIISTNKKPYTNWLSISNLPKQKHQWQSYDWIRHFIQVSNAKRIQTQCKHPILLEWRDLTKLHHLPRPIHLLLQIHSAPKRSKTQRQKNICGRTICTSFLKFLEINTTTPKSKKNTTKNSKRPGINGPWMLELQCRLCLYQAHQSCTP